MKKISLIIAALLFSTFFYNQDIGLNLSLFSVVTTILLIINNKIIFKQKNTIAYTIVYLITSASVYFYVSHLSIIANCAAFFTLVGHTTELNSSIYITWINGVYTSIVSFFHHNFNMINSEEKIEFKKKVNYLHLFKIIGIPLAIVLIFIGLYKNGNPVFNDLISNINFSFINIPWLLLSGLGYYLFYNITNPAQIEPATQNDLNTGNSLIKNTELNIEKLKEENQLGIILMALLNILIIFFLITDIYYLASTNDYTASAFSNQVHSGINALIASIIVAIVIILYFFRGDLNFYKDNKNLKIIAYTWIILNTILVINIAIKDIQYIYYFGLTYKRIGVLIYLLFTLIGLFSTSIKVKQLKNLWYLFRINTLTAFAILIVSCVINWDGHITYYNLYHAKSMDFNYLINLSNNNTFILKLYAEENELTQERTDSIRAKYRKYIKQLQRKNWQETSYDNFFLKN